MAASVAWHDERDSYASRYLLMRSIFGRLNYTQQLSGILATVSERLRI